MEQDLQPAIIDALKYRAVVKQHIYRNTIELFTRMKVVANEIVNSLAEQFKDIDKSVIIEFHDTSEFEFQVKFSGDMLVFSMHSNIVLFPETHILYKSPYIQEADHRKYFGHIMVYNFMADSIKYHRLQDPGYLLARLLLNVENKFYIEGVRQLNFLHPDIAQNDINEGIIRAFIQQAMLAAINNDLQAAPFQKIQVMALGQKINNQMDSGIEKVGFKMGIDRENQ